MRVEKLVIRGVEQDFTSHLSTDELEAPRSYMVGRLNRGQGGQHLVDIQDNELVELVFEDETVWLCNADTIEEVFPEAVVVQQRGREVGFVLPNEVQVVGERGFLGGVGLKIVNIFKKKAVSDATKAVAGSLLGEKVRQLAAKLEDKQLGMERGLRGLNANFTFRPFADTAADKPYLLFLHGTASSTSGSFGGLAATTEWQQIQAAYGLNVAAFQHESLTKSPLQNVLELVEQLPANCTLHLVSHSRGGLIGELLCRFCNVNEARRGFDSNEIGYLEKNGATDEVKRIRDIQKLLETKRITVRKFVRVACPTAGTTLASDRLERFFNITLNLIGLGTGLAANPIYGAFKDLVAAILETKDDVTVLPGLAAMNPASDFIKVLNRPESAIVVESPLKIIAGNCKVKLGLKALLVIASKLFYLKDNDLVVNTASMFKGARRTRPVQFYFDSTAETDHFHYFQNERTVKLLWQALQTTDDDQLLAGFELLPAGGWRGAERGVLLNLEGGKLMLTKVTGSKPIVLLLPGIMGSTLDAGTDELWIDYADFIFGGLNKLAVGKPGIKATGVVSTAYLRLAEYLHASHDVVTFAFDWRLDLAAAAKQLAARIEELMAFNQPIKIVAHSLGGVVMRDLMIDHSALWQRLNRAVGFRLVLLGSPLRGSFRIPAVLFGRDSIIDKLSAIDIIHSKRDLAGLFAAFPGVLSLLPLTTDAANDFADSQTWVRMREAQGDAKWPIPSDALLAAFSAYRDKVLAGMKAFTVSDFSNVVYVAGRGKATPSGYRIATVGGRPTLQFLYTAEGDESVTWDSGIPTPLLEANAVYYADVSHGSLANEKQLFNGLLDLLNRGVTMAISRTRPTVRAVPPTAPPVSAEDFDLTPDGVVKTLLNLTDGAPAAADVVTQQPIRVRVSNGDLRYASSPLLAGHFANDGILSAEREIDRHLDGALTERNALAIYPDEIGTSELFLPLKTESSADYPGAVILGLGQFGLLTAFRLTRTVEQGVARYLHALAVRHSRSGAVGSANLSALLIGSGFGGLSVEDAVRAIVTGVRSANAKVSQLLGDRAPAVAEVEFVEAYQDTAILCYYAAKRIEQNDKNLVQVEGATIKTLFGVKKRFLPDSASGWWNRLAVRLAEPVADPDLIRVLEFSMSTGRAREEKEELRLSTGIVEAFLRELSVQNTWSPQTAKTVFDLLIPYNLKEAVQRQGNLNWILDSVTAAYPWELLQPGLNGVKPLCVSAGMIRQYATEKYREKIIPVARETALVIGDPLLNGFLPQLPGARQEANEVAGQLRDSSLQTTALVGGAALDIIRLLFQDDYKIIHLAGHGVFLPDQPESSGMVLGNNVFLTTREIAQLGSVPELVFVNCCFLGQMDGAAEQYYQNRYKLAANIGTQLIENGVKAVVVAGWAVDDAAALTFARTFYRELLAGCTFGEAVLTARRRVYDESVETGRQHNTWGAYQCYGDPHYKLRNEKTAAARAERSYTLAAEAEVDLRNVYNELESGRYSAAEVLTRIESISQAIDRCGVRSSVLTECEAFIFMELYEFERALTSFRDLMAYDKADFTITTLEKYCNVRAKQAVRHYYQTRDTAKNASQTAIDEIAAAIKGLESLLGVSHTGERLSLLGSAYKRKAQVQPVGDKKTDAYLKAADYYRQASEVAQNSYLVYTFVNWYLLELIVTLHRGATAAAPAYAVPSRVAMREKLQTIGRASATTTMDYWLMLEDANILLTLLVLDIDKPADPARWQELLQKYRNLWSKAGSKYKKMAEVEHVRFLKDALDSVSTSTAKLPAEAKHLKDVKTQLNRLYDALLAMAEA